MLKQTVILVILLVPLASSSENDREAELISSKNLQNLDGAGKFAHETIITNGVDIKAYGNVNGIQGEYSLPGEDGKFVRVTYTADAQGFHPHIEN